ncbi:MAG: hypothetical protein ACK56F_02770 [bacterium]
MVVVSVWVRSFTLSVIFLSMMVAFLQVVVAFSLFLLMTLWIYPVNFDGGKIVASETMLMLLILRPCVLCD